MSVPGRLALETPRSNLAHPSPLRQVGMNRSPYIPGGSSLYVGSEIGGTLAFSNGHNVFGSVVWGIAPGDHQLVPADCLFAAIDPDTSGGRLGLNGGVIPTVALRDAPDNPALGGAARPLEGTSDARGVARPAPAT